MLDPMRRQLRHRLLIVMLGIPGVITGFGLAGDLPRKVAVEPPRVAAATVPPSAPDEQFFATLRRFADWLDPDRTHHPTVAARLEILATEGLPAGLVGLKLQYRWRCPDRAQLRGAIGGEAFTLGREGAALWLWRPARNRLWLARSSASDPLEPLALPLMELWRPRLATLFAVQKEPSATVEGVPCEVLTGRMLKLPQASLGVPGTTLTLWLGQQDHRLRRFRVTFPEQHRALTVAVQDLRERPAGEAFRWSAPAETTQRVESVSLARIRGAFPDAFLEAELLSLVAP